MSHHLNEFIRSLYKTKDFIPLHAPTFGDQEKSNVLDTIETTFVSSVGKYVDEFEREIERFTESPKAVATVNGTAALHTALYMAGVKQGDLVITQALTFV
ncbi:MAG: aminotransferase DegT, partial [Idiomarina sp.]